MSEALKVALRILRSNQGIDGVLFAIYRKLIGCDSI